jgi:hypothetical protein
MHMHEHMEIHQHGYVGIYMHECMNEQAPTCRDFPANIYMIYIQNMNT